MRPDSRQKFFLTVAISLIIVGLLGSVLGWLFGQVKKARATIGETANKIILLEEKRKTARQTQILLKDRASDLAKINKFLVDRGEPVEFIENLEETAQKTKNKIVIDFDEGRSKAKNLFFRLTIDGSEASTRKYLKLLGFMPYKIGVEDLIFQKMSAGDLPAFPSRPKTLENPGSHRLTILIQVETL